MHRLRNYTARVFEGNGKYRRVGRALDVFLMSLIMINVVAIVLESVGPLAKQYHYEFLMIELISVAIFSLEYVLRLWCCVDKSVHKKRSEKTSK